jgi:dethiobiotin synthetase
MRPIFVSGIGTGVGKTIVAAILTEVLEANYWKPVQAGYENGTDSDLIKSLVGNSRTIIHSETYKFETAVSPHIAARNENQRVDLNRIVEDFHGLNSERTLVIEGAGGLLVPLNEREFVIDLVKQLDAVLILVSRNYLGSINHSLMTANTCRSNGIVPGGWVFNDSYLNYEMEIAEWSGYPALFSLPFMDSISKQTLSIAARRIDLSYLYSLL